MQIFRILSFESYTAYDMNGETIKMKIDGHKSKHAIDVGRFVLIANPDFEMLMEALGQSMQTIGRKLTIQRWKSDEVEIEISGIKTIKAQNVGNYTLVAKVDLLIMGTLLKVKNF